MSVFRVSDVRRHHRFFSVLPIHHGTSTIVITSVSISTRRDTRLTDANMPVVNVGYIGPERCNFATTIKVSSSRNSHLITHRLVKLKRHGVICMHASHRISLHFDIRRHCSSFIGTYLRRNIAPAALITRRDRSHVDAVISRLLDLPRVPATVTYRRSNVTVPLVCRLIHYNCHVPSSVSIVNCSSDFCTRSVNLAAVHRSPVNVTHRTTYGALSLVGHGAANVPFRAFPTRLVIHSDASQISLSGNWSLASA